MLLCLRYSIVSFVLFCCMSAPSFAASVSADVLVPASVIAIVDVPRVLKESTAAESVRNQIDVQRSKFQTQIGKEEEGLRKAEKELIKLRDDGKKEAFSEFEQRLRNRFLKVERHVQTRRKALDKAYTDSMNTVRESLIDVVSQISKEKAINLVVVKQQVIWHDKAIDLTDSVLSRLNKQLPKVEVQIQSDEGLMLEKPFILQK